MTGFQAFMAFLHGLQHYPGQCTAYQQVSGYLDSPSNPPQYVVNYGGNCLQAFINVIYHLSTYFSFH